MTGNSSKPLHVSRAAIALIAALTLLPWAVLYFVLGRTESPAPASARATVKETVAPAADGPISLPPGPWGDLVYTRVVIEPPDSLIPSTELRGAPRPVWFFGAVTPAELARWWETIPLKPEERAALTSPVAWEVGPDGIRVRPSPELVLGLSLEARTRIYAQLSRFGENPHQATPFRFRADNADDWLRDGGLAPETLALVKPLIYRRGPSLLFSDIEVVLERIPSQVERVRLVKTLARRTTLMAQLRIHPDTDIDALEAYWGRGQRSRDIGPLLRSMQRRDRVVSIDLIHLLPRAPRQLLYTYPLPDANGQFPFLDCHWTSINFFTLQPEQKSTDHVAVAATIDRDYYLVTGKPTLGDIIMFARPDNSIIHSCVYLADDLVYTKNGGQSVSPWILMTLADVKAFYPSEEPLELQYYRAKTLGGP
jgi:hypothetical protein